MTQAMRLTDFGQGSKSEPGCYDIFPLDLLVIKEPPNILVSDNVTDVSPTNVEESKEQKSGKVATEWLQQMLALKRGSGRVMFASWRLMLLRKKTSKIAMPAQTAYLSRTKKVVYQSCPKVWSPGTVRRLCKSVEKGRLTW